MYKSIIYISIKQVFSNNILYSISLYNMSQVAIKLKTNV